MSFDIGVFDADGPIGPMLVDLFARDTAFTGSVSCTLLGPSEDVVSIVEHFVSKTMLR